MSKDSHPSLINFLKYFEENKAALGEKQIPEEVSESIISKNERIRGSLKLEELVTKYNSNIKDYFFKITATLQNYNFEFTPTIIYLILGEDGASNYIACIYNLKMKDKKDKIIKESNIPYYMSNGLTNHLRANLLLPFICFNLEETKEECPVHTGSFLGKGGLFKYSVINNLYFGHIKRENYDILGEEYMKKLIENSQQGRVKILSVIDRIDNLLDFLICLNNKNIINFDAKDIEKYYPIFNNVLDELNMDVNAAPEFYDAYEDTYKKLLLMDLKRLIINFKKLDIVKFEQVDLKLEKDNIITKAFFNKYINNPKICNDHKISEEGNSNVYKYGIISEQFGEEIKFMLEVFVGIDSQSENGKFAAEFMDLFVDPGYLEKDILNGQLERFNAKCYKKYLKYKSKYFKLKQLINKY
jgi:hypothetical protein